MRTFGVEEELLIADPVDGIPLALANGILETTGPDDGPSLKSEFKQEQIEVNSRPCTSAVQLREEIHLGRALADSAARTLGARVAALATPPVFHATPTLGNQRYATMGTEFGLSVAILSPATTPRSRNAMPRRWVASLTSRYVRTSRSSSRQTCSAWRNAP